MRMIKMKAKEPLSNINAKEDVIDQYLNWRAGK